MGRSPRGSDGVPLTTLCRCEGTDWLGKDVALGAVAFVWGVAVGAVASSSAGKAGRLPKSEVGLLFVGACGAGDLEISSFIPAGNGSPKSEPAPD